MQHTGVSCRLLTNYYPMLQFVRSKFAKKLQLKHNYPGTTGEFEIVQQRNLRKQVEINKF